MLARLIAPAMPHLGEEIHARLNPGSATRWRRNPGRRPIRALLVAEAVTIAVQVMGKLRGTIEVPPNSPESGSCARRNPRSTWRVPWRASGW